MFYVVFLLEVKELVVIPYEWIEESEDNWEKFVKNGLNTSQKFKCFYSQHENAISLDGKPNSSYPPCFEQKSVRFPNEGWYEGKLLMFKGNYYYFSFEMKY